MTIYEFRDDGIVRLSATTFADQGITERGDLQRHLLKNIEIVSPDTLVISEEFSDWSDSNRRIDILGLDRQGALVVIELKRTESGGHMELQAIRYAAMISVMNYEQIVDTYQNYLRRIGQGDIDAGRQIEAFLEAPIETVGEDVRIVLASAEFSTEVTSTVLWLNEQGLDIRCWRLRPYTLEGRVLIDAQQLIPLPEAEAFQIRVREKNEQQRSVRRSTRDIRRFDAIIDGNVHSSLPKRTLAHVIVKAAIERGFHPDDIAGVLLGSRRWFSVDGEYAEENAFVQLAAQKFPKFDQRRYFTADDELFVVDGQTYALSNQWGTNTIPSVEGVLDLIDDEAITYREASN